MALAAFRLGGVVIDLRREFLEFRFDRHVHLLEDGRDAAFGRVGFERRRRRRAHWRR
jgi:hypothetical protein